MLMGTHRCDFCHFFIIAYFTSKIQFLLVKDRETSRDHLSQVKMLTGLMPICVSCKKIRDDKGDWNRIEQYVDERKNGQFTYGLCPECIDKPLKEVRSCKLPQPAGSLFGIVSNQTFPIRKSF
jgi:hypothetical protein